MKPYCLKAKHNLLNISGLRTTMSHRYHIDIKGKIHVTDQRPENQDFGC
jgi:hypothetical protein